MKQKFRLTDLKPGILKHRWRFLLPSLWMAGLLFSGTALWPQTPPLNDLLRQQGGGNLPSWLESGETDPAALLEKSQKKAPGIVIENASEGEFLRGGDDSRGLLILRGRIRVRLPHGVFTANTVIVDANRQEIYGEGNLYYHSTGSEDPYTEIRGERLIYDQKLGNGIIYNASGYMEPLYFIGKSVQQIGEMKFSVSHTLFTSCAAERPHYNFTARKIWIYENHKVMAVGVLYHVGGVPLLPLPFLYASEWGTGVITQIGMSDVQGAFMQNTYQFSVPSAYLSSWQPTAYRFTLDLYQNTGESGGVEMYRFSPHLNYVIQLGGAGFRRYEVIPDFREKNKIRITNQVQRNDGTTGEDYYKWKKIFTILNYKGGDPAKNTVRNFHIRYEDYTHRLYDFEFGGRYQPTSTIPALYQNSEAGRGIIHNSTNWNLVYNEMHDDLNVRVEATRDRRWQEYSDFEDSKYIPIHDVVPSVDISKNLYLGRMPGVDLPFYWYNGLHSDVTKDYSNGAEFKSVNHNLFVSSLKTYWSLYPYITISPQGGYGAQKEIYRGDVDADKREAQRNSYEFYFSRTELTLGPDFLFARAVHTKRDSFNEELRYNPPINPRAYSSRQKVNETEVSVEFNPSSRFHLSASSIYDHRKFEQDVKPEERWSYPVLRADFYFDFLNFNRPERENLLSRNRIHFMGLHLTNEYVYDPILKRDHSDVVGVVFEAGGFDLWLLERLRFLEMGFYWYHVYYNPALDHMRYSFKTDIQLSRYVYFEMEMESRATDVARYSKDSVDENGDSDHVPFDRDVLNGIGLYGGEKRQNAVFNVGYFESSLVFDLHEWEMRIGLSVEQRSIYAGVNSLEIVNFYDRRVFASLSLLRFDIERVGSRPSRFILNKQRVRPSDVGRVPVRAQRVY